MLDLGITPFPLRNPLLRLVLWQNKYPYDPIKHHSSLENPLKAHALAHLNQPTKPCGPFDLHEAFDIVERVVATDVPGGRRLEDDGELIVQGA